MINRPATIKYVIQLMLYAGMWVNLGGTYSSLWLAEQRIRDFGKHDAKCNRRCYRIIEVDND
jgi:hypothetical protein